MATDLLQSLHARAKGKVAVSHDLDDLFSSSAGFTFTSLPTSEFKFETKKSSAAEVQPTETESEAEAEESEEEVEVEAKDRSAQRERRKSRREREEESEERLERTVFVGNVPMAVSKKDLEKEFRDFGAIESIRFRSVARGETTMPRRAAAISGTVDETRQSKNAYIVFAEKDGVLGAVKRNGDAILGHHIRVDVATQKGQSREYDQSRTVFIGQLRFDAEDDALWTHFGGCGTIEAVRVVRDSKTNKGKGIAFVSFADKASVQKSLKLDGSLLGGRAIRVSRVSKDAATKSSAAKSAATDAKAATGKRSHSESRTTDARGSKGFEGAHAVEGDVPNLKRRKALSHFKKATKQEKHKKERTARRKAKDTTTQSEKRTKKMTKVSHA